jgi:hypothetical protein
MGAQSFSGYYDGIPGHYPHVEGELGYALQRPGVFPISGNDAAALLQRQASNPSLAFLAQQNPMLSSSFSNVSSTPGSAALSSVSMSGSMNFQSPGDLLQSLGLQDQGSFDNNYLGSNVATSLLAQQLAEYSGPDQQQQHMLGRHQSDMSIGTSGAYGSAGPQMYGSYHGMTNYTAPTGPMSLSSLPPFQSASLGNYGGNVPDQNQQAYLAQLNSQLMNMQGAVSQMNNLDPNEQNGSSDQDLRYR